MKKGRRTKLHPKGRVLVPRLLAFGKDNVPELVVVKVALGLVVLERLVQRVLLERRKLAPLVRHP